MIISYSCIKKQENKIVKIYNEDLSVKIATFGAELMSIYNLKESKEYLWQGDTTVWGGRAPIMFPVNVKFKDGSFSYKGKKYSMPVLGVASKNYFKIVPSNKSNVAAFEFESTKDILNNYYPFPFKLNVTYKLIKNELIHEYLIENKGADSLFFALGAHPGISCPLTNDLSRNDYQISFTDTVTMDRYYLNKGLFYDSLVPFLKKEKSITLADKRVPKSGMFFRDIKLRKVGVGYKEKEPFITFDLGNFPNVNIWSPPGYPLVCVEPMLAHHDLVNSPIEIKKKPHLQSLPPGKSKRYYFKIIVNGEK